MKEYIKPQLKTIDLDMEGSVLTSSGEEERDEAGFGDPSDVID